MTILFALLSTLLGIALVFGGYRIARFLIPLAGFIAGLSVGGAIIADANNAPFLGTLLGILVGLFLGVIFAVFAYLFYGAAVIMIAGVLGYWLGSSFILLFGFQPGLLSALVGLGVGVIVGIGALLLRTPKFLLVFITAVAGAVFTIGGVLLLFNQIPLESFNYAVAQEKISDSFLWTVLAIALAGVGIAVQAMTTKDYYFSDWNLPVEEPEKLEAKE